MLELLVVYSCPVLITGDVNIHLDDPNDVNTIKFNGILESFGLIQSVIGPTHLLGRTLDVVITRNNLPKPIINIGLPGEISDHSLLVLQLQLPRPPVNFVNVSTRAWKSFDEHSFRSELRSSKLCNPGEYGGASVDDLQELYDTTLRTLLDKHAPSRSARRRYQPTTPWFDAECAAAKRKTRALERRYRRTRLVDDRTAWTTQAQKKHQLYGRKHRVNSGRGKSLIAGAIQRNCGGTSSLFFDRRKKSHQVLRSSLPRHSRTLSLRSWRAYGHQLHQLHPRFSITRHVSPVSFGSRPSIPPRYYASSAMLLASPANSTQFLLG